MQYIEKLIRALRRLSAQIGFGEGGWPILVAAVVVIVGGVVGAIVWLAGDKSTTIANGEACKAIETYEVTADDFIKGDPNAPVTLIEYASMTCPHCARFHGEVLPLVEKNFIDKGYVRYVFREFPLDGVALAISVTGRCLAHDAYLPFVSMMYQEQMTWASPTNPDLRASIKELARRAGMSGEDFEACLKKPDDAKKIQAAQQKAITDYCISGTPTFILEGKVIASGEIPYADLEQKIREELKKKGKDVPASADATAPAPEAPPAGEAPAPAGETPPEGAAAPTETPATNAPAEPPPATPAPATTPQ